MSTHIGATPQTSCTQTTRASSQMTSYTRWNPGVGDIDAQSRQVGPASLDSLTLSGALDESVGQLQGLKAARSRWLAKHPDLAPLPQRVTIEGRGPERAAPAVEWRGKLPLPTPVDLPGPDEPPPAPQPVELPEVQAPAGPRPRPEWRGSAPRPRRVDPFAPPAPEPGRALVRPLSQSK